MGDDLRGAIRIQKPVAQDLADDLIGAAVEGFGTGLAGEQGGQAPALEGLEELIVALTAVAIFSGDEADVAVKALALQEHEEAGGQGVSGSNGQRAAGAGQLMSIGLEVEWSVHGKRIREAG